MGPALLPSLSQCWAQGLFPRQISAELHVQAGLLVGGGGAFPILAWPCGPERLSEAGEGSTRPPQPHAHTLALEVVPGRVWCGELSPWRPRWQNLFPGTHLLKDHGLGIAWERFQCLSVAFSSGKKFPLGLFFSSVSL